MGKEPEPVGGEKYKRLIAAAQRQTRIKVAVAHPCDDVSLRGAIEAHKLGIDRADPRRAIGASPKRGPRGSPGHHRVRAGRIGA